MKICSCECSNRHFAIVGDLSEGVHLFSYRTQKLRPSAPKILAWKRAGKIGHCQLSNLKRPKGLFFRFAQPIFPTLVAGKTLRDAPFAS